MNEKMLTKKEVAAILGCHWVTVNRLMRLRKLEYIKRPKGHVAFRPAVVQAFMSGATIRAVP